jgi:hypothetical protein
MTRSSPGEAMIPNVIIATRSLLGSTATTISRITMAGRANSKSAAREMIRSTTPP